MPSKSQEDITTIFEEYHKERLPAVLESFSNSQVSTKMVETSIIGAVVLFIMTHLPMWLWRFLLTKTVRYRPQVGFLPAIPLQGTVAPFVSPSEQKARAVFEENQQRATSI
ncbi:hypothetical protein BGW39_001633 [Mortierella sp. 14UC]|nr:hypothetical protein BGW39_001633 [Mortierella sp. 14UC]